MNTQSDVTTVQSPVKEDYPSRFQTKHDLKVLAIVYVAGLLFLFFLKIPIGVIFNVIIAAEISAIPVSRLFAPKVDEVTANSKKMLGEEAHQIGKAIVFLFCCIFIGIPVFGIITIPYILVYL